MNISLRPPLAGLGTRIDALSLRERAILFASTVVVVLALLDQAVLAPVLVAQRSREARLLKLGSELAQLRQQVTALGGDHPDANPEQDRLLTEVRAAQAQKQALAHQLQTSLAQTPPVRLPDLLAQALQRHERLTLVKLASGTPQAVGSKRPDAAAAAATPNKLAAALSGRPMWQRAELSVAGSYADLSRFVAELERSLPGLRWGPLHLDTDTSPPVLTVQLWLQGEPP